MKKHYIYVIGRDEGPVKVGVSSFPGGRLTQVQTGCSYQIKILHLRECRDRVDALRHERIFHDDHADRRLSGEWFDMDAELAIDSIEADFEIQEHFENEARLERMAAELNIWQWEGAA
jgi:hypothetical protein